MAVRFCDKVAVLLVAVVVTVSPWLFGGVLAQHQFWMCIATITGLGFAAAGFVMGAWRETRLSWPLLLLAGVILATGALGVFQQIPLSPQVHASLSPKTHDWWTAFSLDPRPSPAPTETSTDVERFPVSVYPARTREDLASLGLPLGVLVIAALCIRTEITAMLLLGLLAVNGAVFSIFGIVQALTFNDKLYWTVPLVQGGLPFAGFVNRNHAGAYLNLCVAASLALLFWAWQRKHQIRASSDPYDKVLAKYEMAGYGVLGNADHLVAIGAALAVINTAGVMCSLSRGAVVAFLAAMLVTVVILPRTRASNAARRLLLLVATIGVLVAVWLGRGAILQERFAGTFDDGIGDSRLEHWWDGLHAARDLWGLGSGLGTYLYAYRPFQTRPFPGWYLHAENQYLEAVVVGGLVGFGLLVAGLGVSLAAARWKVRRGNSTAEFAIGTGCLFGLCTVAVHAFFDFNLYLPAVACLAALMAALPMLVFARTVTSSAPLRQVLAIGLLAGAASWLLWGTAEMRAIADAAKSVDRNRDWHDADTLRVEAERVHQVLRQRPDDAELRRQLALINTGIFKAEMVAVLAGNRGVDEASLWRLVEPLAIHGKARQLMRDGKSAQLKTLVKTPLIQDRLQESFQQFRLARAGCPLLAATHLDLAELSLLCETPEAEVVHLDRALTLIKLDPGMLFRAGLLNLQSGRMEAGFQQWQTCLQLSRQYMDAIVQSGLSLMAPDDFVERVLPRTPRRLVEIARRHFSHDEAIDMRLRVVELADSLVDAEDDDPDTAYLLAALSELRGDTELAIEQYKFAVERSPRSVEWRYQLANLLLAAGNVLEAHHHALVSVRLDPTKEKYRQLLQKADGQLHSSVR